jgi:hypothetical protein
MLMAVLTLALGFVAPAWAVHTADPLEEFYAQHVLPFYNIDTNWRSFAVFADTSFTTFGNGSPIHLYFFDQSCNLARDDIVTLTDNDVAIIELGTGTLVGLPTQGVIFADSGFFATGNSAPTDLFARPFLAYMILVNLADNTLTRIDSIPFSRCLGTGCNVSPPTGAHWTRYDPFNTIAATFGDRRGLPPLVPSNNTENIQTTLLFFNALGGGTAGAPPIGARDTLREFMAFYGVPSGGDWLTTGGSATASATPGLLELDAYDADENFLGSFRINPRCFERVRIGQSLPTTPVTPALIPVLRDRPLGHVVAFALRDFNRPACLDGRCAFSGFQETTVEGGTVDLIFSGYFHHSSAVGSNSLPLRPGL